MGVKWYNPEVFDNGLNQIVNDVDEIHLIKAFTIGDSYATVIGNSVGSAALAAPDKVLGDQPSGRQVATPQKNTTVSADSATTDDLHFALVDTVNSKVVAVTDETTDQEVTTGNPLIIPPLNWKMNQPA